MRASGQLLDITGDPLDSRFRTDILMTPREFERPYLELPALQDALEARCNALPIEASSQHHACAHALDTEGGHLRFHVRWNKHLRDTRE